MGTMTTPNIFLGLGILLPIIGLEGSERAPKTRIALMIYHVMETRLVVRKGYASWRKKVLAVTIRIFAPLVPVVLGDVLL